MGLVNPVDNLKLMSVPLLVTPRTLLGHHATASTWPCSIYCVSPRPAEKVSLSADVIQKPSDKEAHSHSARVRSQVSHHPCVDASFETPRGVRCGKTHHVLASSGPCQGEERVMINKGYPGGDGLLANLISSNIGSICSGQGWLAVRFRMHDV